MKELISCEFNIDTNCVEAKFSDGSMIALNCTAVDNEVADNMYERSELDWLVYNAPVDYINLVLNRDVKSYLKNETNFNLPTMKYDCLWYCLSHYPLLFYTYTLLFSKQLILDVICISFSKDDPMQK